MNDLAYIIDCMTDMDRRKSQLIALLTKLLLQYMEQDEIDRIINETMNTK